MKLLTIMVTASGAPGTAALLRGLRENGERPVRLVGTDMSERSIGRHLCDAFHVVPAGSDPSFPDAMLEVAERERVDAILPQSSFDLEGLARHVDRFPMPVLVSKPDTITRSNTTSRASTPFRRSACTFSHGIPAMFTGACVTRSCGRSVTVSCPCLTPA